MATNLEALIANLGGLDAEALIKLIIAAEECHAKKLDEARLVESAALRLDLPDSLFLRRIKAPRAKPDNRTKQAVLYRGPRGESWTGRGKAPRWLAALEAQGESRDRYREHATLWGSLRG